MSDVTVREATADDVPALLSLWARLEEEQGPFRLLPVVAEAHERIEGYFRSAIADDEATMLLAEAGGRPVAMALVRLEGASRMSDDRVADIGRMFVEPAWRRSGVARALISRAEEFARARGARWLSAKIFSRNAAAIRFWERSGFEGHYEQRVRRIDP